MDFTLLLMLIYFQSEATHCLNLCHLTSTLMRPWSIMGTLGVHQCIPRLQYPYTLLLPTAKSIAHAHILASRLDVKLLHFLHGVMYRLSGELCTGAFNRFLTGHICALNFWLHMIFTSKLFILSTSVSVQPWIMTCQSGVYSMPVRHVSTNSRMSPCLNSTGSSQ